jgi:hypothetical protein
MSKFLSSAIRRPQSSVAFGPLAVCVVALLMLTSATARAQSTVPTGRHWLVVFAKTSAIPPDRNSIANFRAQEGADVKPERYLYLLVNCAIMPDPAVLKFFTIVAANQKALGALILVSPGLQTTLVYDRVISGWEPVETLTLAGVGQTQSLAAFGPPKPELPVVAPGTFDPTGDSKDPKKDSKSMTAEEKAELALKQAKEFIEKGEIEEAKKKLHLILDLYSKTKAAKEAKELLDKLENPDKKQSAESEAKAKIAVPPPSAPTPVATPKPAAPASGDFNPEKFLTPKVMAGLVLLGIVVAAAFVIPAVVRRLNAEEEEASDRPKKNKKRRRRELDDDDDDE